MFSILVTFLMCIVTVSTSPPTYAVTDYQCGRSFDINEETYFTYDGDSLSFPCTIVLKPDRYKYYSNREICVKATQYDTSCKVDVEYHFGFEGSIADGESSCTASSPTKDYCTTMSSIHVKFLKGFSTFSTRGSRIKLKTYIKLDEEFTAEVNRITGIVVGVIVGILVLLGIVSLIVIIICCKRRTRRAPGMVYNQGQQMQTTVVNPGQYPQGTGYPPQAYPPQQQYYPVGNQPAGFNPPLAGFSTTPAGDYGAGFQAPPPYESLDKSASAPPLSAP